MNTPDLYRTLTFNHDFGFKEYVTPSCECDPKREILRRELADYKNKPRQGKFKVQTKPKICYFDELAKVTSDLPPPSQYKTEGNLLRRSKSMSIKKILVNLKTSKRTFLDEIETFNAKFKTPGVGKFDLTKYTEIGKKKYSPLKGSSTKVKYNNFDDAIKLAAELPGPGEFNPHKRVDKIHVDRTNFKMWKEKHSREEKKIARSLSAKLGPNTYRPIVAGTFESQAADKSRPISRWKHGAIDVRKGVRSEYKSPSPSQYNTTNQWVKSSEKQKKIGSVNLLNRVTSARSFCGFGVYH